MNEIKIDPEKFRNFKIWDNREEKTLVNSTPTYIQIGEYETQSYLMMNIEARPYYSIGIELKEGYSIGFNIPKEIYDSLSETKKEGGE